MKKILILFAISFSTMQTTQALPNFDVSAGGMPFRLLQEQQFQDESFKGVHRQYHNAEEDIDMKEMKEPPKMEAEYNLQSIKKPAQIRVNQTKTGPNMQLLEDNGGVFIKELGN